MSRSEHKSMRPDKLISKLKGQPAETVAKLAKLKQSHYPVDVKNPALIYDIATVLYQLNWRFNNLLLIFVCVELNSRPMCSRNWNSWTLAEGVVGNL